MATKNRNAIVVWQPSSNACTHLAKMMKLSHHQQDRNNPKKATPNTLCSDTVEYLILITVG